MSRCIVHRSLKLLSNRRETGFKQQNPCANHEIHVLFEDGLLPIIRIVCHTLMIPILIARNVIHVHCNFKMLLRYLTDNFSIIKTNAVACKINVQLIKMGCNVGVYCGKLFSLKFLKFLFFAFLLLCVTVT